MQALTGPDILRARDASERAGVNQETASIINMIIVNSKKIEKEHHVPRDRHLNVHTGDMVEAGSALTDGPLVPHDILRIKGEEALQRYLIAEIQNVYRSQNVNINDKHIEIIASQMMRKVEIESVGGSSLLPGEVVDKFIFNV